MVGGEVVEEGGRIEGLGGCERARRGAVGDDLGAALQRVGRFAEAITARPDAGTMFRETGDRQSEDIAVGNLEAAQEALCSRAALINGMGKIVRNENAN